MLFRCLLASIAITGLLGLAACSENVADNAADTAAYDSASTATTAADAPAIAVDTPLVAADARPATAQEAPMTAPPMSDPLPAIEMTCDAERAKPGAIGKAASAAVVEQARIDAGARMARVIPPDTMVTMEFIEGRLNIDVDEDNVIINLRCG